MVFDYRKLRERIVEKFMSQGSFAKALNMSERTLSLKLCGKRPWKQAEICVAMHLLELPEEYINEYFFTQDVQNI